MTMSSGAQDARPPAVLTVHDLGWTRGRSVVSSVSCRLARGEILLVVGSNASGKSSLLSVFAGELEATTGIIDRPASVELVSSDRLTDQDIAEALATSNDFAVPHAGSLAALHATRRQTLESLSTGERQRIALLRALGSNAELVLLESPTQTLDVEGREFAVMVIRDLAARSKAIVATTVDPDLIVDIDEAGVLRLADGLSHQVREPLVSLCQ